MPRKSQASEEKESPSWKKDSPGRQKIDSIIEEERAKILARAKKLVKEKYGPPAAKGKKGKASPKQKKEVKEVEEEEEEEEGEQEENGQSDHGNVFKSKLGVSAMMSRVVPLIVVLIALLASSVSIYGGYWQGPQETAAIKAAKQERIRVCSLARQHDDDSRCFVAVNHYNISQCFSYEEGDCYFTETYQQARTLFREQARAAGAEVFSLPPVGDENEDLVTDVAILRGASTKFVLHMSGVHGVEGFAGSAIQSAALHLLKHHPHGSEDSTFAPTIVFIHAVNPYGFAHSRRVNENNVDLNRNFLTDEEFVAVKNRDPNYAGYVDVDEAGLINPTSQISSSLWINDIYNGMKTLYAVYHHGLLKLKRALVSGNYHKNTGVGFGGFTREASTRNLIQLVQHRLNITGSEATEGVVLVDVHTGLGPSGTDTLIASSRPDVEPVIVQKVLHEKFPGGRQECDYEFGSANVATVDNTDQKTMTEDNEVGAGYELTVGTSTKQFCRNFLAPPQLLSGPVEKGPYQLLCITQEFGTVDTVTVGRSMIAENYAYYYGTTHEKEVYGKRYRDSFYLHQDMEWKRKVVHRGLILLFQAIAFMDSQTTIET